MIEIRITKVMVASLALFALLVTFDNLTDYDTNYAFVRHVLSMDTTFPGNALLYRRISSPAQWQVGYALIIVGEGLSGIALAVATISLAWRLRSDGVHFNHAKRFVIRRGSWVSSVVLRFYGRWRRVVFDVAISDVEWPGGGISLLHDDPCCVDLR